MKRLKYAAAMGLVTGAVMASALSGCGAKAAKTADAAGTAGTAKETSSANAGQSEEPVEMWFLMGSQTTEVNDDAEVVKEIEERFNIDLKGFAVGAKNFEENLNVRIAGGEMPDVMVIDTPAQLAAYVEGGVIAELPIELIREKAPNYAKCADENDDGSLWSTLIYNGKNYGVSNPWRVYPMAMVWNKSWLDKLGLDVPESLEEYEEVLTAFVENDPDGNGKKDTAGLAERSFGAVFGAYGLRCVTGSSTGFLVEEMQLGEDNVPFFPYIRPEAKEALALLHSWYEKGIVDVEFITGENHGGYQWLSHSFMNGRIGLTSAQPTHYLSGGTDTSDPENWGECMKEFKGLNPEGDIVFGPAPVGPDGKSGTEAWGKVGKLTCLTTKGADDPRKVDAFLAMLDAYYSDMEYAKLVTMGLEGIHYEKSSFGMKRLKNPTELRQDGVLIVSFGDTVPYVENVTPEKARFSEEVTGNGYYRFNVPATQEFSNAIATLDTLTEQAFFDIITGEKPIDYFDTFVEEFKKAGGEAAEKSVQEAYKEKLQAVTE